LPTERILDPVDRSARPIVGRDQEIVAIERMLDRAIEGPTALLLAGEAGIGKTTLWRIGLDIAGERGFRVLAAAPAEADSELPYATLGDLLRSVADTALPGLPDPQRRALEVALLLDGETGDATEHLTVGSGVLGVLRALSMERPLVVAIDDVQWTDPPTRRVLDFALRRLERTVIAIFQTQRSATDGDGGPPAILGALPADRIDERALGALRLEDLDHVMRRHLGTVFLRPTLVQLHAASGGNPFFAIEIGRALIRLGSDHVPGDPLPVPGTLRGLIADRLAILPSEVRETLLAVASVADPSLQVLDAVVPGAAAAAQQASDAAVVRVVDGRLRFTHPLLASAVYGDAAPAQRRAMHAALARAVSDPIERARHLAHVSLVPDADVAARLADAAAAAHARAAPEVAASLAEHAVRLTPGRDGLASERRLSAADYHLLSGDLERARALLDEVLEREEQALPRARALHRLARIAAIRDGFAPAQAALCEALRLTDDPRLRVAVLADRVTYLLQGGDLREAHDHADEMVRLARALDDRASIGTALMNRAMTGCILGRGLDRDLLTAALEATPAGSTPHAPILGPQVLAGVLLKWVDDFADARRHLETALRRADDAHDETTLAVVLFHLGELELWAGDWERADDLARRAARAASLSGLDLLVNFARYLQAVLDAHRGRRDLARQAIAEGSEVARRLGDRRGDIRYRALLGAMALTDGDAATASDELRAAGDLARSSGYGEPGVLRMAGDEIEATVTAGDLGRAIDLLGDLEERAARLDRPWAIAVARRCRGLVAAAGGRLDDAEAALRRSLRAHDRQPQRFERARTQLVLAGVLRRRRQKRETRMLLDEAAATFRDLGATPWAARAERDRTRVGGRAAVGDELTEAERRVADLASVGRTNREIADELFVSVKTVERHMSTVLGKLGLASRRALRRHTGSNRGTSTGSFGGGPT
jgi:DNA-binding CsgD family transcriptional regulator